MTRKRPCLGSRSPCPTRALTANPTGRCDTCRHKHDRDRGTTTERGYGAEHQALRARYEPLVQAGNATCWRCGELIEAGADFDLGHDDDDRGKYRGPEHRACNRATAGRGPGKKGL